MALSDLPTLANDPRTVRQKGERGPRRRTRAQIDAAVDRAESVKVRTRSGGQCEVRYPYGIRSQADPLAYTLRCMHLATQIHHMIGGRGKRGRGLSALAEHKQAVCDRCHLDITGDLGGKRLRRIGGVVPLWTDCYERIR